MSGLDVLLCTFLRHKQLFVCTAAGLSGTDIVHFRTMNKNMTGYCAVIALVHTECTWPCRFAPGSARQRNQHSAVHPLRTENDRARIGDNALDRLCLDTGLMNTPDTKASCRKT